MGAERESCFLRNSAPMASRSAVVMPGSRWAAMWCMVRATMRPIAINPMRSSWFFTIMPCLLSANGSSSAWTHYIAGLGSLVDSTGLREWSMGAIVLGISGWGLGVGDWV